jgi:copper chaperone NosL
VTSHPHPKIDAFYEFLDRPIRLGARVLLALLVIPMTLGMVQPLWRMSMVAPQYPHGLRIDLYSYKLAGGNDNHDITEINELNHYIGMMKVDRESMSDLSWLPFAFGLLIVIALRAAAIGSVRSLIDLSVLVGYVAVFSMARFVYKLYTFGHYLDPRAPVHIEPFMPVVLGTKQVANFTTHSYPLVGTYLVLVFAFGIFALTAWHLWRGYRERWGGPAAAAE